MYQVHRESLSTFVTVRHHSYHVRQWGQRQDGVPPLFLMHGWMDVGASFQFVVDAMVQDRWILAPDWRGYGLTTGPEADNFWFPDYLADLDALVDHYSADQPIDLVGHSMGGNVVMQYASVRPQRIRRLVNLEGFGMAKTRPENAPKRLRQWLDELKAQHAGELELAAYENADGVARRLMKNNKRLSEDKALWLAQHWGAPGADGRWHIRGHSGHKVVNAYLSRVEEQLAMYREIQAPTLVVEAEECSLDQWWQGKFTLGEFHERLQQVPHCRRELVMDAGHMMHHDQPHIVASLIEQHLAD